MNITEFPIKGETGVKYLDDDTGVNYIWNGEWYESIYEDAASIGTKIHEEREGLVITPAVLANGYYAGEDQIPEVYEAWAKGYEYAIKNLNLSDLMYVPKDSFTKNPPEVVYVETAGKKENQGKLSYELDWEFIEAMAARMSKNKGKYEPYNWKKPIEVEQLKQSLIRHVVEIMKGNYSDDGDELGHLSAAALNAMMLNYQLK